MGNRNSPTSHQPIPMAASTPYTPAVNKEVHIPCSWGHSDSLLHPIELSNTSRVIAAALHHAKLEPPVFTDDDKMHLRDWLQAVNNYRSSLNMTHKYWVNCRTFLQESPASDLKHLVHMSTLGQSSASSSEQFFCPLTTRNA